MFQVLIVCTAPNRSYLLSCKRLVSPIQLNFRFFGSLFGFFPGKRGFRVSIPVSQLLLQPSLSGYLRFDQQGLLRKAMTNVLSSVQCFHGHNTFQFRRLPWMVPAGVEQYPASSRGLCKSSNTLSPKVRTGQPASVHNVFRLYFPLNFLVSLAKVSRLITPKSER